MIECIWNIIVEIFIKLNLGYMRYFLHCNMWSDMTNTREANSAKCLHIVSAHPEDDQHNGGSSPKPSTSAVMFYGM